MCGHQSVPWGTILLASTWADREAGNLMVRNSALKVSARMTLPCSMHFNILHCWAINPSDLLRTVPYFKATDPRDKVFALVAFPPLNFHPLWKIRVDYNLTTQQVYLQTTAACIMQSKRLDVLWQIHHSDAGPLEPFHEPGKSLAQDGFATWAPRWDQQPRHQVFTWMEPWEATKGLATTFEGDDAEYLKLHVRGLEPGQLVKSESSGEKEIKGAAVVTAIQCPREPSVKILQIRGIKIDVATSGTVTMHPGW
jgi:hypothetical protein